MTWMNENLHSMIAQHFGKVTLRVVRDYEKTARKIADYRNHLRFNLRCRQHRIIPKSLLLRSTVKGHRANSIMERAQYHLLNERVRQVHFTIGGLKNKGHGLVQQLTQLLPPEILDRVKTFVDVAQLAQHHKSKERQQLKFVTLQRRTHNHIGEKEDNRANTSTTTTQDKWVKNLSDKDLTEPEKDVLAKGLNFAVTPKQVPIVELITATESAIRKNKLSTTQAEELRLKVTAALSEAKNPTPNLSRQEMKAVASLSKDENITILPADKGRCTVVLNTVDYHNKVAALLEDGNTYEPLKRDPTSKYKKKVIDCLQELQKEGIIDRPQYHRLYPGDTIPRIYGLPKIHKEGTPLRPIVSSINSVTYNIAKHVASILAPLVGHTAHHVHNSTDFVDKIREVIMARDETMVSYDVTSLFTCVPTAEATETVRRRLLEDTTLGDRTNLTPDQICQLLDLCLTTTYFQYKGGFYRQKHGCAMGSPVSPIVANLYMEEVERRALDSFHGVSPSHWFRYVDDTWVKIKTHEVQPFTEHINSVDNNIKFTREDVKDNTLPFLDCEVRIEEDRTLSVGVYRKPTHTDQYLLFDSHHPLEHKMSVIRTLQHRALHIPTSTQNKERESKHVKAALKTCGYPEWAFTKSVSRGRGDKKEDQERARLRSIVIPYVAGVSEKLRRIFNRQQIPVFFKPSHTLRQRLVHPKDPIPHSAKNNVVYAVQCSEECSDLYIGETKQPLNKRMYQHRRANSSGPESAVFLHLKKEGHSFQDENVQILDREERWFERGVKEAIYVKIKKPSLNRGGGLRHNLSTTYNAVLSQLK